MGALKDILEPLVGGGEGGLICRNDFKLKELSGLPGESVKSKGLADSCGGDFGEDVEGEDVCLFHAKRDGRFGIGGEGV